MPQQEAIGPGSGRPAGRPAAAAGPPGRGPRWPALRVDREKSRGRRGGGFIAAANRPYPPKVRAGSGPAPGRAAGGPGNLISIWPAASPASVSRDRGLVETRERSLFAKASTANGLFKLSSGRARDINPRGLIS